MLYLLHILYTLDKQISDFPLEEGQFVVGAGRTVDCALQEVRVLLGHSNILTETQTRFLYDIASFARITTH